MDSSNSGMAMRFLLERAAMIAASLTRFARSAPEKPGVRLASVSRAMSLSRGLPFVCTSRMATRPLTSGASMTTWRSKRPGRSSAGSRMSGRGAARAADRVDLVDEDDAGRVTLRLVEEVAHAGAADADELFDELGAADRKEGHARLAGDGAGEQRLARPRRADEQDAPRDARAQRDELLWVLQELDDLLQLLLSLVHAGDVDEGHGGLVGGEHAGAALAEAHRLRVRALRLAHHEQDEADEDEDGQELQQQPDPVAEGARLLDLDGDLGDVDVVLAEDGKDAGAVLLARGVVRAAGVVADDLEAVPFH